MTALRVTVTVRLRRLTLLDLLLLAPCAHMVAARPPPPEAVHWPAGAAKLLFDPATTTAVLLPGGASDISISGRCSGGGAAASIFDVRVWRKQGQPFGTRGWSEDDSVHLHPSEWQWDASRSNVTAFVYTHNASGLEAKLDASGSDDTQHGLALTLALRNTGQAAVYVAELTFPRICGIA
eukprot:SAG11_NODE_12180_length_717_cov_1.000000_1_plen_179_part_01